MKTAIIYYSKHHGNTKKLLDAIAQNFDVTLIDVTSNPITNLNSYDRIGFASGIYYSSFNKTLLNYAKKYLPTNKSVFFIYTYSVKRKGYTKAITQIVNEKSAKILGSFSSLGFNTFGPFKLIKGIAKNHPNEKDLKHAISFYEEMMSC